MKTTIATLIAATLFLPRSPGAETILTDDLFVRSGKSYPSSSVITVDPTSTGFIKFDLSPLPDGTIPGQVKKATLKLYVSSVSRPGLLGLRIQPLDWDESSAPLPPASDIVAQKQLANTNKRKFITFDVTDAVREWIADPISNHGFAIGALDSSLRVNFDSKENVASSHAPELLLTYSSTFVALRLDGGGANQTLNTGDTTIKGYSMARIHDPLNGFDPQTGHYTAKTDGWFLIQGAVQIYNQPNNQSGSERRLRVIQSRNNLLVSDESLWFTSIMTVGPQSTHMFGSKLLELQTGDVVRLESYLTGNAVTANPIRFEIIKVE